MFLGHRHPRFYVYEIWGSIIIPPTILLTELLTEKQFLIFHLSAFKVKRWQWVSAIASSKNIYVPAIKRFKGDFDRQLELILVCVNGTTRIRIQII